MRKRRILLVGLACLLLAVALILLWPSDPPEPSYGGKRLSEWVIDLHGEFTVEQANALDAIGTNGIPALLRWVTYDTPGWKLAYYNDLNRARAIFHMKRVLNRRQILAEEATTALSRFVRDAPQIATECQRLAIQTNLPPNVRGRINHLLYVEWSYRRDETNLSLMAMTNGLPQR